MTDKELEREVHLSVAVSSDRSEWKNDSGAMTFRGAGEHSMHHGDRMLYVFADDAVVCHSAGGRRGGGTRALRVKLRLNAAEIEVVSVRVVRGDW